MRSQLRAMITRLRDAIRANPALAAILALALTLNLIGITWGLPNTEPWIADSVSGELTLKVWITYASSSHKYPYLQWWLAFLAYAPLLAWWLLTGQLDAGCWPYLKAKCFEGDPFAQLGTLILISRLLSALMGVGTVWLTWRLALAVGASRRAALLSALGCALAYVAVFYAHLGNLDGPMTFWYSLSLLAFVGILRRGQLRDYAAFGLSSGAALGTKEGVIGAYVLSALAILFVQVRPAAGGDLGSPGTRPRLAATGAGLRRLVDRRMLALVFGLLLVYGLATNPVFNLPGFIAHWRDWLPSEGRMQGYQAKRGLVEVTLRAARMQAAALDLPLLLLCLAGLALSLRRWRRPEAGWPLTLLIPSLSYLAFSVYLSRIVEMRVLLPLVPVLCVYGGLAADRLLATPPRLRRPVMGLLILVYLHAGLHSLNHDLHFRRDSRYTAEAFLQERVPREASILVYGSSRYVPRLAWLGYQARFVDASAASPAALAALDPEYIVLSSRSYDRFAGQPEGAFFARLLAGESGYRELLDARSGPPLRWSFDPFQASDSVDPRISILQRDPAR